MSVEKLGALVAWEHEPTEHGVALTMRVARTVAEFRAVEGPQVNVILNDRQLREFAIDIVKAATERGIEFYPPKRRWWQL